MVHNILITGSTGKQGTALIRALLKPRERVESRTRESSEARSDEKAQHEAAAVTPAGTSRQQQGDKEYHIYALTRNISSATAQKLLSTYGESISLVQGNLDDAGSIEQVFRDRRESDGVGFWGVFAVLAFPGLGVAADGEEKQGKMLADMSLKYGVQAFIYSSSLRAGPKHEHDQKLSSLAKARIEQHCMELGKKGLPWIILRPSFFLENFDGLIGAISVSVLRTGLKPETAISMVGSEDIGKVAAGIFLDHSKHIHKVFVLCSDCLTMGQVEEAHKRALGHAIPAIPNMLASLIIRANGATQDLINNLEHVHVSRINGHYPELTREIQLSNEVFPMRSYHDWLLREKDDAISNADMGKEWNGVSIIKLLTGRL
ncbi:hypothetical protein BP5796_09478 [Coleophoma crateriformis]|uniref:NmrA-like domain-containing protein n=1 Tax=Coleophoma crateriformis TaxID=565419 RepID=A0A3D8QY66_9HELO|nr:hypothetical protein BP5796_09478 [Coleophoma crateriformis]